MKLIAAAAALMLIAGTAFAHPSNQDVLDALQAAKQEILGAIATPEPAPEPEPEPTPDPEPDPAPVESGWTSVITNDAFWAVAPSDSELAALPGPSIRGTIGPEAIFRKWTGGGFDPATGRVFQTGGGNTDYGGNEVYVGHVDEGRWTRAIDPAPLTGAPIIDPSTGEPYVDGDGDTYPAPAWGPVTAHGYGHPFYHAASNTFWSTNPDATYHPAGAGIDLKPRRTKLWRFDVASGEWQSLASPLPNEAIPGRGFSVYDPQRQRGYILGSGYQIIVEPDGSVREGIGQRGPTFHAATYAETFDEVWSVRNSYGAGLSHYEITEDGLRLIENIAMPADVAGALTGYPGIAEREGIFWLYGGQSLVTYDPASDIWTIFPRAETDPTSSLVYGKFWYWSERDVFVMVDAIGGVWLLNPNENTAGEVVDPDAKRAELNGTQYATINEAIDAALDGDTVTILPGTYREAFEVRQNDLTILAHDVVIDDVDIQGKAVIVQYGTNLIIEGIEAKNLDDSSNTALVRMEPSASGLTLRGVYVHDTHGGMVVTGNNLPSAGTITIEDSVGERNGHGGQSHHVYCGYRCAALIVRNSRFVGGQGGGHLIKSRGQRTELYDVVLDSADGAGVEGNNSRAVDVPSGGVLILDGVTLRHGPNVENHEMIGYALEANRNWHLPESITIRNSTFVDARGGSTFLRIGQKADPTGHVADPEILLENNAFDGVTGEATYR